MTSGPTNQRPGAIRVPVGDGDPDVLADRLLVAGASAVAVTTSPDGGTELLVDLDPCVVEALGLRTRPSDAVPDPATGWVEVAFPGPAGAELSVTVESGVAFGSGTHASTRLCLAALAGVAPEAARVLDVGCGTGVLGVAALALGAEHVRAIDVDAAAVASTLRTAGANGFAERVLADDMPLAVVEGTFDLVLANLLVPIVEELGSELADRVGPGGYLVVGGLLLEHRTRALAALASPGGLGGLEPVQGFVEGGWVALELVRR